MQRHLKQGSFLTAGIVFIVIIIWWVFQDENHARLILQISLIDFIISTFLIFFIFFINGCMTYYLVRRENHISLKLVDVALLPIMQRLIGYIFPFRGGLAFSVLFLKMKYRIKLTIGISIGMFTFLIILQLSALYALCYSFHHGHLFSVITPVSLFVLFLPHTLGFWGAALNKLQFKHGVFLQATKILVQDLIITQKKFYRDWRLSGITYGLTVLNIFVYTLWFFWSTRVILNIEISTVYLVGIVLAMKFSLILNFLPGNLGVQEFITGSAFYLFNGNLTEGFILALFFRLSVIVLIGSIGILGLLHNIRYFNMSEIKEIWNTLRQTDPNS